MSDPLKIFICYAREDRPSLDMLMGHLAVFERNGSVKFWYDEAITGGKDWDAEIRFNLKSADIVLLLISPEFFRSDYIHSVELAEALERDTQKEALVVPVILKKCLWHRHKEIARLQALPEKGNPVWDKNHWSDPDDGFYDVAVRFDLILEDPDTEARRARKQTRLEEIAAAEAEEREMRKRKEELERQEKEKVEQKRREEALKSFIEMVHIQGGAFQFGDKITVTVPDFMIGKYPVTQKQWREIMGNNPSHFKGDELPVENVSWEDAQAFIQKLNEQFPGHHFRLPSEAE